MFTHLLGHLFAHSDRNLLVHILAVLQGLVGAYLVRNLHTLLPWDINTDLLGHIMAHWVGNLSLLGLAHIFAGLIGVGLAGAGNWSPNLVISMTLPLVFTVLLVLCGALSLGVGLVLCVELLLIHGVAFLPCGWLAQSLCLSPAHLLILGGAHLSLSLGVLSVPNGGVLGPAMHS